MLLAPLTQRQQVSEPTTVDSPAIERRRGLSGAWDTNVYKWRNEATTEGVVPQLHYWTVLGSH